MRIVEDDRQPVVWLNYRRKANVDPERSMGPTMDGERIWPVEVLDRENGGMRIGFSYIAFPNG